MFCYMWNVKKESIGIADHELKLAANNSHGRKYTSLIENGKHYIVVIKTNCIHIYNLRIFLNVSTFTSQFQG